MAQEKIEGKQLRQKRVKNRGVWRKTS